MKNFSIDRIEDELAVLIDDEGNVKKVSLKQLPPDVTEGDVLNFDGNKYVFDPSKTTAKRKEVKSLIDQLFQ